jgi:hypothetical protein
MNVSRKLRYVSTEHSLNAPAIVAEVKNAAILVPSSDRLYQLHGRYEHREGDLRSTCYLTTYQEI